MHHLRINGPHDPRNDPQIKQGWVRVTMGVGWVLGVPGMLGVLGVLRTGCAGGRGGGVGRGVCRGWVLPSHHKARRAVR